MIWVVLGGILACTGSLAYMVRFDPPSPPSWFSMVPPVAFVLGLSVAVIGTVGLIARMLP